MKILRKNQKGFTLIELLMVISIVSLIATMVLTSTTTARKKARDKKRLEEVHQISTALNLYAADNNQTYPPTGVSGGTWRCLGHSSAQTCWVGVYNGNDTLNTALSPYIRTPDDPLNATTCSGDAYLYHSNYTGLSPNGAYIHWQYEDTSSSAASACGRGVAGATNSCGGTCWLYVGPGNAN